jgi:cation diffusion facilitator CzcD-associated flavoprotein CzcO
MTVPVAIIGAGPYGLSLSAHLTARDVEHRIIGRTMETWDRHMPNGMFLKSEGFASSIDDPKGRGTLRTFCEEAGLPYADIGPPISIDTYRAYGHWFQQQLVPHVEEDEATSVVRDGEGFSIELKSGVRATARRIVVASGITRFAYVPPALRSLPPDRVSHTHEHTDFAEFRGRRVAVIGAGQSALETAALLREAGASPELIVRAAAVHWNGEPEIDSYHSASRPWHLRPTPLGGGGELWGYWKSLPAFHLVPERKRVRFVKRALGPAGAWWLFPRVAESVPIRLGQKVVGAEVADAGVVIELAGAKEAERLRVDHVVAGTGYRIDVDRLTLLSPDIRNGLRRLQLARGAPLLSSRFESSEPGLYFIGLAAANTSGPAMRFVCGTRFAAPRLGRHLSGKARTTRLQLARTRQSA